jgi:hypothetical protein
LHQTRHPGTRPGEQGDQHQAGEHHRPRPSALEMGAEHRQGRTRDDQQSGIHGGSSHRTGQSIVQFDRVLTQRRPHPARARQHACMDASSVPNESGGAARRAARLATPRLTRELNTIAAMLRIYCRDQHGAVARGNAQMCAECAGLQDFARKRLAGCPFGADKPTCVNCQIHCYGARQREAMRAVMRYAGPRMLWRHPVLALAHLADGRRAAPPKPRGRVPAKSGDPTTAPPG